MHLKTRNVNTAFRELIQGIHTQKIPAKRSPSRVGEVLRLTETLTLTYSHPQECVLFNQARDANPFFAVYESLYMLAGRNDVAPLTYYNSKIAGMASDDGAIFNGGYGARWRHHYASSGDIFDEVDQIPLLLNYLRKHPEGRRAVLTMWTVADDLLKVEKTLDTCCNLCAVFSRRGDSLDMTVYNRSNDIILGMLGANAVHFSFLLQYLAACLGLGVGCYHQVSCDAHVYINNWQPVKWLECEEGEAQRRYHPDLTLVPLVRDPESFDEELPLVVEHFNGTVRQPNPVIDSLTEPFLRHVAAPLLRSFELYKTYREYATALRMLDLVQADDWRIVAQSWLKRRLAKKGVTA